MKPLQSAGWLLLFLAVYGAVWGLMEWNVTIGLIVIGLASCILLVVFPRKKRT